jgi:hypothetical protein
VHGHVGDRVIPIFELTDQMLAEIDLQDGNFGEWEELIGPPTLISLDFWQISQSGSAGEKDIDPSDLAFQIWLGWNDTHERIYVGAVFSDDTYIDNSAEHGMLPMPMV